MSSVWKAHHFMFCANQLAGKWMDYYPCLATQVNQVLDNIFVTEHYWSTITHSRENSILDDGCISSDNFRACKGGWVHNGIKWILIYIDMHTSYLIVECSRVKWNNNKQLRLGVLHQLNLQNDIRICCNRDWNNACGKGVFNHEYAHGHSIIREITSVSGVCNPWT